MGIGSGKVLPESSKTGYFCPKRSTACGKHEDLDEFKRKPRACLWRWKKDQRASKEGSTEEMKESVDLEKRMKNPNAKFRAKFDARVIARY